MIINILLGVLGIVLYTLIKAQRFAFSDTENFNWNILLKENLPSWIWATILVVLVAVVLNFVPSATEFLSDYLKTDLVNSPVGFISLGIFLSIGTKEASR